MAFGNNDASPMARWTTGKIIMPKTAPNVKPKWSRVNIPEYLHAQLRMAAAEAHVPVASIVEAILDSAQHEFRAIARRLRNESVRTTAA